MSNLIDLHKTRNSYKRHVDLDRAVTAKISRAGYTGTHVISGVNLDVDDGKAVLIAGQSGSGKTTLLFSITGVLVHLLGGFTEGSVSIYELNPLTISGFNEMIRSNLVGLVLQDPERHLVFPTPLDELTALYSTRGISYEESTKLSLKVLEVVGLRGKELRHVEDLSTGERRRLSLAVVLASNPKLLLLDEPSANLDSEGIKLVRGIIADFKRKGSVVIVEHKPQYFRDLVDSAYCLDRGRVQECLLTSELEVKIPRCEERSSSNRGEILVKAESLVVGYGEEVVLRNVELEVKRGEIVCVVGPNGSGKSTLLKVIAGILKPIEGSIKVNSKNVFYAPQNPDLVFTRRTVKDELRRVLSRRGLTINDVLIHFPWLQGLLDYSPYKLSHGQRRLLELLLAFNYSSDILLLDEPTTGLDPAHYVQLYKKIVETASRGIGVIIATHDPRLVADVATRVYQITSGELREVDKCKAVEEMMRGFLL
jgi:energy-coupling factor transport system ATP-binding protein